MSAAVDLEGARRAVLRYQPPSNWVSLSQDPTPRTTIGLGFDLTRPDASKLLAEVGLDLAAVRSGQVPISDVQMSDVFDLTLRAAIELAQRRVPGFAEMTPERQSALLELLVWLGPAGSEGVLRELEAMSLPLTDEPPAPSAWIDRDRIGAAPAPAAIATGPRPARAVERDGRWRITFESFGLVAGVISDDAELLDASRAMLPPGWRAVDGPPVAEFGLWADGVITVDGVRRDRSPFRDEALLKLGTIVRHHLATEAPVFTFVHAGVVAVGGRGIVIPGRSFTGKSTLVAELVGLGASYVSDEYAVLDPAGLVHPFAKPLSIRAGRHDRLGRLVPAPEAQVATAPVRADLIVLTSYVPGAQWRPWTRSRAEGAFALLQNTVSARQRPGAALVATSRLARDAEFLVGKRGEAAETATALIEAVLRQSDPSNTFHT